MGWQTYGTMYLFCSFSLPKHIHILRFRWIVSAKQQGSREDLRSSMRSPKLWLRSRTLALLKVPVERKHGFATATAGHTYMRCFQHVHHFFIQNQAKSPKITQKLTSSNKSAALGKSRQLIDVITRSCDAQIFSQAILPNLHIRDQGRNAIVALLPQICLLGKTKKKQCKAKTNSHKPKETVFERGLHKSHAHYRESPQAKTGLLWKTKLRHFLLMSWVVDEILQAMLFLTRHKWLRMLLRSPVFHHIHSGFMFFLMPPLACSVHSTFLVDRLWLPMNATPYIPFQFWDSCKCFQCI